MEIFFKQNKIIFIINSYEATSGNNKVSAAAWTLGEGWARSKGEANSGTAVLFAITGVLSLLPVGWTTANPARVCESAFRCYYFPPLQARLGDPRWLLSTASRCRRHRRRRECRSRISSPASCPSCPCQDSTRATRKSNSYRPPSSCDPDSYTCACTVTFPSREILSRMDCC